MYLFMKVSLSPDIIFVVDCCLKHQLKAARLVVRALPHVHITPILRHLHWLPVRARISYEIACLCFTANTSSTPAYLSDLQLYSPSRSLRSSADSRLLKIPLYKCKTRWSCFLLLWFFCLELLATAH